MHRGAPQVTGGRNGYGAKLANIFSTHFSVETADGSRQRRFMQTFSDNMSRHGPPQPPCAPTRFAAPQPLKHWPH